MVSALALTLVAAVGTVVSLVVFSLVIFRTAVRFANGFDPDAAIERADELASAYVGLEALLGVSFEELATDAADRVVSPLADLYEATGTIATSFRIGIGIGLPVLILLLYYFLKDSDRPFWWVRMVTPLEQAMITEFFDETHRITWSVLKIHVFVAIVEGIAAGIGLWLPGVPNTLFWTTVMIVLSILPVIGVWLVWGSAVIHPFGMSGAPRAVAPLVNGLSVPAFIGEYLRADLVNRGSRLHPAVVLVGVIGGISLLGVLGLFLGPILLAVFKTSVNVLSREHNPTDGPTPLGAGSRLVDGGDPAETGSEGSAEG